jgi:aarF domain-containing kinase
VLTAEWIDGVRLSDREALGRVVGEKLPEKGGGMFADTVHEEKKNGIPESMNHVKLKGGMHAIMHTMVHNLFFLILMTDLSPIRAG